MLQADISDSTVTAVMIISRSCSSICVACCLAHCLTCSLACCLDCLYSHCSVLDKLVINGEGAVLSAQEPWGIIRGLETFSQIMYYHDQTTVVNATYIKDFPRFRFRGLMIDTARHYIPIANIKCTMVSMSTRSHGV